MFPTKSVDQREVLVPHVANVSDFEVPHDIRNICNAIILENAPEYRRHNALIAGMDRILKEPSGPALSQSLTKFPLRGERTVENLYSPPSASRHCLRH